MYEVKRLFELRADGKGMGMSFLGKRLLWLQVRRTEIQKVSETNSGMHGSVKLLRFLKQTNNATAVKRSLGQLRLFCWAYMYF